MNKLTDYIREYPNFMSREKCEEFVQLFDMIPDKVSEFDSPVYRFKQLNMSKSFPNVSIDIAYHMDAVAKQYFRDVGAAQWIPPYGFESIRIKKYEPDGEYRFDTHVDVARAEDSKRFLIMLVYLRDNDAGETVFPSLDVSVKCEAGKIVCFPPTWQYPHAGLRPVKESKYIMMSCLHYLNTQGEYA